MMYEKRIREIIASIIRTNIDVNDYKANKDLREIGMDSISFVSIVVAIENEFGIEFPEDKLLISEAGTIELFTRVVDNNINVIHAKNN